MLFGFVDLISKSSFKFEKVKSYGFTDNKLNLHSFIASRSLIAAQAMNNIIGTIIIFFIDKYTLP